MKLRKSAFTPPLVMGCFTMLLLLPLWMLFLPAVLLKSAISWMIRA